MKNLFSLKNKIIVITGGSGNLGKDFAQTLLEFEAKVAIFDLIDNNENENENIKYFNVDITNKDQIIKNLNKVKSIWGVPSGLINNAGIDSPPDSNSNTNIAFEKYSDSDWNKVMDVNLKGAFYCSQVIGYEMAKNMNGSIININSIYGNVSPDQRVYSHISNNEKRFYKPFVYGASKAGLSNLTKYLATYWAKENIRINTMTLGGVYNNQDAQFVRKYEYKVPMGRMANTEDFRGGLIYLLSDSSRYVTGTDLIIDGGFSAW